MRESRRIMGVGSEVVARSKIGPASSVAIWTLPFLISGSVFAAKDGIDSTKALALLVTGGALLLSLSLICCTLGRGAPSSPIERQDDDTDDWLQGITPRG